MHLPAKANSLSVQTFMVNKSLSDSDSETESSGKELRYAVSRGCLYTLQKGEMEIMRKGQTDTSPHVCMPACMTERNNSKYNFISVPHVSPHPIPNTGLCPLSQSLILSHPGLDMV